MSLEYLEASYNDKEAWAEAREFRNFLLATAKRPETIVRIWQACLQIDTSTKSITVANVGRVTEQHWNSPKTQSIRDQPTSLKRLVELCAAAQRKEVKPTNHAAEYKGFDNLVVEISDPNSRAKLRQILAENTRLRKEVKALRAAYLQLEPPRAPVSPAQKAQDTSVDEAPLSHSLTSEERRELERAVDPSFWYDEGYTLNEIHGLMSASGRTILKSAFFRGLRRSLGNVLED